MLSSSILVSKLVLCRSSHNSTLSRSLSVRRNMEFRRKSSIFGSAKDGKLSQNRNGIQWVRSDPTAILEKPEMEQARKKPMKSSDNHESVEKWTRRDPSSVVQKTYDQSQGPVVEKGNFYTTKPIDKSKNQMQNQRRAGLLKTSDRKFETQLEVDNFIRFDLHKCSNTNIADLMRISCKASKKNRNTGYLSKHLPLIASQLDVLSSSAWSFRDISAVIYGLQCIDVQTEGLLDIFSIMTTVAANSVKSFNGIQSLEARHISMMLLGFQNMNSEEKAVLDLLAVASKMTSSCKEKFSAQAIGNAIYGLQGMSSDAKEVQDLLSALSVKVFSCEQDLNSQEVGNALYGLKGMSSDHSEVCNLLSALALNLDLNKEGLDAQAVGNALYGLQGMNSDQSEVRQILSVLVMKVRNCSQIMDSQAIGNALYGLRGMNSDHPEVRDMLRVLEAKVQHCRSFSAQAVGNTLYGLQSMNSNCVEVRNMLTALERKITDCREDLSAQEVSCALHGLKFMTFDHPEVRDILFAIKSKGERFMTNEDAGEIDSIVDGFGDVKDDGFRSLVFETEETSSESFDEEYSLQEGTDDNSKTDKGFGSESFDLESSFQEGTNNDSTINNDFYGIEGINFESFDEEYSLQEGNISNSNVNGDFHQSLLLNYDNKGKLIKEETPESLYLQKMRKEAKSKERTLRQKEELILIIELFRLELTENHPESVNWAGVSISRLQLNELYNKLKVEGKCGRIESKKFEFLNRKKQADFLIAEIRSC